MNKTSLIGKIASASLALALTAGFNNAQAQSVAGPFLALPAGTSVVDFVNPQYSSDYKVDLISENWQKYYWGSPDSTRFVGYGWGTFAYEGVTRPEDQVFTKDYSGTIDVTRNDGGLFAFDSVALYGNFLGVPYVFTGWEGATQVFSTSGSVDAGNFFDVANPYASKLIDRLEITLTSVGNPDCATVTPSCSFTTGSYVAAKDIILTKASAVPEPASLALLAAGFAVAGAASRRKRVG